MKRFTILGISMLFLLTLMVFPVQSTWANQSWEMSQQDYQKWGDIAVRVAKEAYPNKKVSDYEYVGRQEKTATTAEDTFRLVLKNQQDQPILVRVTFNTETEQLISVNIEEEGARP